MATAEGILDKNDLLGAGLKEAMQDLGFRPDLMATSRMAQVAARGMWNNSLHPSETQAGFRYWNYNYAPVTTLRIWFYNGYITPVSGLLVETGTGGSALYRISIEYPKGTFTPLASLVIPDNTVGYVDIPVSIPAFAWYRIGGDIQAQGSGKIPYVNYVNISDLGNGDMIGFGSTNYGKANTTDYFNGGGLAVAAGPVLIQAVHDLPVWVGLGDSIVSGVSDFVADPTGGRGILGRAMCLNGPNINVGVGGDSAAGFKVAANSAQRRSIITASGATRGFMQLGSNDLFALNNTRTQLESSRQSVRSIWPAIAWLDLTILPRTSSSDGFKTAANQVPTNSTNEASRVDFNTRVRSGIYLSAGSSGTVDIAGLVETSPSVEVKPVINGGVSLVGVTDDGAHMNSAGIERITPALTRAMLLRR